MRQEPEEKSGTKFITFSHVLRKRKNVILLLHIRKAPTRLFDNWRLGEEDPWC